jgi:transposase-like protein
VAVPPVVDGLFGRFDHRCDLGDASAALDQIEDAAAKLGCVCTWHLLHLRSMTESNKPSPLNRGHITPDLGNEDGVMGTETSPGKPTTRRYSEPEKERAVRMVRQLRAKLGTDHGTVKRVAEQLGIGTESLRSWVKRDEIDAGVKPGLSSEDAARIKALEQENRELKRANGILRSASAFSRRNSTAHRNDRRLHRRSPSRVRSRVDLSHVADRSEHVLRRCQATGCAVGSGGS